MNEKNKKVKNGVAKVKSSRNRNKNKNKVLQEKIRNKEKVKKIKNEIKEEIKDVSKEVVENTAEIATNNLRDDIIIVPERVALTKVDNVVSNDIVSEENVVEHNVKEVGIDRFIFVDDGKDNKDLAVDETVSEVELEEFNNYNSDNVVSEEKLVEQLPKEEIKVVDISNNKAKTYVSFETRVITLLVAIVVAFFIAGLFIFNAIREGNYSGVVYNEKSTVNYEVCVMDNQYYEDKCLDENMEYLTEIVKNVPISFEYNIEYSDDVSTEFSYYVVSKMNIYTKQHGKVLNTLEDVLIQRTPVNISGASSNISLDVDLPFEEYRKHVVDYNSKYNLDAYAALELNFYIDNGNRIKKVSTVSMPVSEKTFGISKNVVDNEKQSLTVTGSEFGELNATYATIAVVFALIGLFCIIKLANLILKVTGNRSLYQRKLQRILKDYDRVIVTSRDGYNIGEDKKVIKVTSFVELLDARDTLEKPIVYVRVNNVKSEFYVEDLNTVYQYVMKEADIEEK